MQEKEIINTKQYVWLLFIIITSVTSIHVPGLLIMHAERDAWLAVIGGWFLDIMLALVYAYMGIRFKGQNFVQYSMTILGPYLGRVIGLLFLLFFLLAAILLQRGTSQLINGVFLPKTPLLVIMAASFLCVGYAARKGIEVIARVTELLGPVYLLSIIVVSVLVAPMANLDYLKPQFNDGLYPFLSGSVFVLSFYGICVMMAMFIPICNRPENGFVAKFTAVSLGAFFVGSVVILSTALFSMPQAKNMAVLGLEMTRMISIGRFVERVEVIWMMIVIGAGVVSSAILIWAVCLGLSQVLGLKNYKPLVYPTVLVAFVLSLKSFDNYMEHLNFIYYSYPFFAVSIEGGLVICLFILALLLNKKAA